MLDIGYKVLTSIMDRRLRGWLEEKKLLTESQAGFRKNRATRDHIFVLNSLIGNRLRRKGHKLYMAFVDFKTAFDEIDRELLLEKLKKIGVNGKMLKMIGEIYRKTENEVITSEGITDSFRTWKGVRQGALYALPYSGYL